jgi:protein TonB
MPVRKTPEADLRRRRPLYAEVGMIVALVLVIAAFTVPTAPREAPAVAASPDVPLEVEFVPPTEQTPPPPPPPAAPPPPVEVPNDIDVEDIVDAIDLSFENVAPIDPAPPAPPSPPVLDVPVPEPPPAPVLPDETPDPGVFEVAEVQPELIGGLAGLQERVEYPEFARRAGIEGQVVVQFVVDERGNVVDPVVLRSPNELLSEAALEAVRESRFTPGQQRGRPVKVRFAVPVTFRLR